MNIFVIAALGSLGVLLRYFLDRSLAGAFGTFPFSIFFINILGSFLTGTLYVYGFERELLSESLRLGLGVGLLGGFTTFSAYSLQVVLLAETQQWMPVLVYFALSPVFGVLSAWLGLIVGRKF